MWYTQKVKIQQKHTRVNMREIDSKIIEDAVYGLFCEACLCPPDDVMDLFKCVRQDEPTEIAKEIMSQIINNADIAKHDKVPYCQDTGMAVVFAEIGQDVHINGNFNEAINNGVRRAYKDCFYRKSVLTPISRVNTSDNTPAVIHTSLTDGDKIKLTALPKGFGSENMSKIAMLSPSAGKEGIIDFVVNTAVIASGNPCPPVVIGVGIGGTFEYAALMSKRQLARPINSLNGDPILAEMENEIKNRINSLGMGPMGLGGNNYCVKVCIEQYPTHIAGLPVAVNYCCHAIRHAQTII